MRYLKIFTLLTLCSLSSFVLANNEEQSTREVNNYFNGWYIGIGLGTNISHGHGKSTFYDVEFTETYDSKTYKTSTKEGPTRTSFFDKTFNHASLATNFFMGYGDIVNESFYLGSELYLRISPTHFTVSENSSVDGLAYTSALDVKNNTSAGVGIRGGYLFTPKVMAYLLLAADAHNMRIKIKHSPVGNAGVSHSYSPGGVSIVPSIGIETMLTEKMSLRAQYSYYYHNSCGGQESGYPQYHDYVPMGESYTYNVSLSDNKINGIARHVFFVDLAYRFNGV